MGEIFTNLVANSNSFTANKKRKKSIRIQRENKREFGNQGL